MHSKAGSATPHLHNVHVLEPANSACPTSAKQLIAGRSHSPRHDGQYTVDNYKNTMDLPLRENILVEQEAHGGAASLLIPCWALHLAQL